MRRLEDMTWEEVRDLDRGRTAAILPVGALEAHGPHLPLATDVLIAGGMAEAGARRLAAQGLGAVLLPPLAYTPAGFAAAFPGTLGVRGDTLSALLLELAEGLSGHAFRVLALANAHLDPAHLRAIHRARAEAARRGLLPIAFPDLTRKPWAPRLGEEFRSGACHAGRYEGSVVLALAPELVRDRIRRELPPNPASLSGAIREGARSFEEAGGPRAYFGWPAEASAEEGRRTLEVLGEILAEAVVGALESRPGVPDADRSEAGAPSASAAAPRAADEGGGGRRAEES